MTIMLAEIYCPKRRKNIVFCCDEGWEEIKQDNDCSLLQRKQCKYLINDKCTFEEK